MLVLVIITVPVLELAVIRVYYQSSMMLASLVSTPRDSPWKKLHISNPNLSVPDT